jgi:hypothetical protein
MKLRIIVLVLSAIAVVVGIAWALRVAQADNARIPLYDPFFVFLLPAIGLIALGFLSLVLGRSNLRVASIVLVVMMAIFALVAPVILVPLGISLVGVIPLNLGHRRGGNQAR